MKKMLLAIGSEPLREALSEDLSEIYHLCVCAGGNETLQAIHEFHPDLMILDLMLPEMDGISILRAAGAARMDMTVLAITPQINTYMAATLEQLRVGYIMRIPCDCNQIIARIMEMELWKSGQTDTKRELEIMLASLGFYINTSGYRITVLALQRLLADPGQKITTQLYPQVAEEIHGTSMQVERAIRSSITSAWKRCNEQQWRALFATGKNGKVMKPTNLEFLSRLAAYIQAEVLAKNERAI